MTPLLYPPGVSFGLPLLLGVLLAVVAVTLAIGAVRVACRLLLRQIAHPRE